MGYVLVTPQKQLIVIDGGHAEDAEPLLSLLAERAEDARPRVSLWIITHPHLDHYGALREIASKEALRERVTVEELVYCFPESFRDLAGRPTCVRANAHMEEIRKAWNANVHTPSEDETRELDGILLTYWSIPSDTTDIHNPNSLSLIFSLQGSQKTVMITGDACPVSLRKCVERCGSKLKSDILQMPHHGLCDTGYEAFYRAVAADTLLIPISRAGDLAMHSDIYKEAALINQAAELAAGTRYPAYQGIVSMTI